MHPSLSLLNTASPGSFIFFPGDNADLILTNRSITTENNITITKDSKMTIPAAQWMVNGIQNGNATYGRLIQQSTGYAVYTAPSGGYYGPVTLSASVIKADGSQETSLAPTAYIVPKNLRYYCSYTVGCKCPALESPGMLGFMNSQGVEFHFHLERSAQNQCNAVFDDGPAPIEGSPIKNYSSCAPTYEISDFDYGQDMAMSNPKCEYDGADNMLHFSFDAHAQDLPGYSVKFTGADKVIYTEQVIKATQTTWVPQVNISNLPYTSPVSTESASGGGGWVIKSKYGVNVAQ